MLTLTIFVVLVGLVMLGVPIFAAMGLTAAGTFIALGDAFVLPMMAQRMYVATTGFTLLAIPFFILAGNLMNHGGITQRVFDFARALVGHFSGGLGHVNVVASMIFSGMSGRRGGRRRGPRPGRDEGDDRERLRPRVQRRHHRRLVDHRPGDSAVHRLRRLRQHHRGVDRQAVHGRLRARRADGRLDDGRGLPDFPLPRLSDRPVAELAPPVDHLPQIAAGAAHAGHHHRRHPRRHLHADRGGRGGVDLRAVRRRRLVPRIQSQGPAGDHLGIGQAERPGAVHHRHRRILRLADDPPEHPGRRSSSG